MSTQAEPESPDVDVTALFTAGTKTLVLVQPHVHVLHGLAHSVEPWSTWTAFRG